MNTFEFTEHIEIQKFIKGYAEQVFRELGWVSLDLSMNFHTSLTVFRCLKGFCPSYLRNHFFKIQMYTVIPTVVDLISKCLKKSFETF